MGHTATWKKNVPGKRDSKHIPVKGKVCSINMQSVKAVSRRDRSRENKVESARTWSRTVCMVQVISVL